MKLIIFILSFTALPIFGSLEVILLNRDQEIVHYEPLTSLENNTYEILNARNFICRHPLIIGLQFEGFTDPVVQHELPIHNRIVNSLHRRLTTQKGLERFITLVSMIKEQERFIRILKIRQKVVLARQALRREIAFIIIPDQLAGLRRAREESTNRDYSSSSPTVIAEQEALSENSSEFSYISLTDTSRSSTDNSGSSSPSFTYSEYG